MYFLPALGGNPKKFASFVFLALLLWLLPLQSGPITLISITPKSEDIYKNIFLTISRIRTFVLPTCFSTHYWIVFLKTIFESKPKFLKCRFNMNAFSIFIGILRAFVVLRCIFTFKNNFGLVSKIHTIAECWHVLFTPVFTEMYSKKLHWA